MKYLLDTNICVHFLRGAYNLDVKLRSVGLENCFISEITLAELEYGVENSDVAFQAKQRKSLQEFSKTFEALTLPIRSSFTLYAQNRTRLRKIGLSISDFDLLIGCTAVAHGLIMVTENTSEFSRINRIQLENWILRSI
mgnify:CR=1 FL=1